VPAPFPVRCAGALAGASPRSLLRWCVRVFRARQAPRRQSRTRRMLRSPSALQPDRSQEFCRRSCRLGCLHVSQQRYGRACSRSFLPEPTASSNIPARLSLRGGSPVAKSGRTYTSGHQQDSQGQSLRLHADRRSIERLCNAVGVHARSSQRSKFSNIVSGPGLTVPGCLGHCCSRRNRAFRTACKSLCSGDFRCWRRVFSRDGTRFHFGSADDLSSPNSRSQTRPTRPRE
jgi:hypothetical protein